MIRFTLNYRVVVLIEKVFFSYINIIKKRNNILFYFETIYVIINFNNYVESIKTEFSITLICI